MRNLRRTLCFVLFVVAFGRAGLITPSAEPPPRVDEVLSQAKAEARSQHKHIFLIFGASWCVWCSKLDKFNETPEVSAILVKSFVFSHLTVEERGEKASLDNPGAQELMNKLGGKGGLPFFAFLDADGNAFVTSNRPSNGEPGDMNIGFPGDAQEVAWFVTMVRKAVPSLTSDEAKIMEKQLRRK